MRRNNVGGVSGPTSSSSSSSSSSILKNNLDEQLAALNDPVQKQSLLYAGFAYVLSPFAFNNTNTFTTSNTTNAYTATPHPTPTLPPNNTACASSISVNGNHTSQNRSITSVTTKQPPPPPQQHQQRTSDYFADDLGSFDDYDHLLASIDLDEHVVMKQTRDSSNNFNQTTRSPSTSTATPPLNSFDSPPTTTFNSQTTSATTNSKKTQLISLKKKATQTTTSHASTNTHQYGGIDEFVEEDEDMVDLVDESGHKSNYFDSTPPDSLVSRRKTTSKPTPTPAKSTTSAKPTTPVTTTASSTKKPGQQQHNKHYVDDSDDEVPLFDLTGDDEDEKQKSSIAYDNIGDDDVFSSFDLDAVVSQHQQQKSLANSRTQPQSSSNAAAPSQQQQQQPALLPEHLRNSEFAKMPTEALQGVLDVISKKVRDISDEIIVIVTSAGF